MSNPGILLCLSPWCKNEGEWDFLHSFTCLSVCVTHGFEERVAFLVGKEGGKLLERAGGGGSLVPHAEQVGRCKQGESCFCWGEKVLFLVSFQGKCLC